MDPKALAKAKRRLRVAEESAASLKSAPDYEVFSDRWYVFLHAAKGIYTTLEQGAKASPQARQWFGGKNQERKDDPLLRYLSEARNDDEHGIEDTTEVVRQSLSLGVPGPGNSSVMRDQFGNTFIDCAAPAYKIVGGAPNMPGLPQLRALDGKPVKSVFSPERIALKAVYDRAKHPYDPPKQHLGKDLESGDPAEVAELALSYLGRLLDEAEGFCRP